MNTTEFLKSSEAGYREGVKDGLLPCDLLCGRQRTGSTESRRPQNALSETKTAINYSTGAEQNRLQRRRHGRRGALRKEGGGRVEEEIYPAGASDIKKRFFPRFFSLSNCGETRDLASDGALVTFSHPELWFQEKPELHLCLGKKNKNHLAISSLAFPKQISSKPSVQYSYISACRRD